MKARPALRLSAAARLAREAACRLLPAAALALGLAAAAHAQTLTLTTTSVNESTSGATVNFTFTASADRAYQARADFGSEECRWITASSTANFSGTSHTGSITVNTRAVNGDQTCFVRVRSSVGIEASAALTITDSSAGTLQISNTGQTATSHNVIVGTSVNRKISQRFTTGTNAGGYALDGVDIGLRAVSGGTIDLAEFDLRIYTTNASGDPDRSLYILSKTSSFAADAVNKFTADDPSATLDASTTYAVVAAINNTTASVSMGSTDSNAEDSGGAAGWSIFDTTDWSENDGAWGTNQTALRIAIPGSNWTGPVVSVSGGSAVTEGGDAVFTVTVSPAPTGPLTVWLDIEQTGSFVFSTNLGAKSVAIPASGTTTYRVSTDNDGVGEANGAVTATLLSARGYTRHATLANRSASVTVNDNDGTAQNPVMSISGGSAVTEGGGAEFTVTASPAPAANKTVNLTIAQTGDFVAAGDLGAKTVTVTTSGTATYTVNTVNDSTSEAAGAVTATLGTGTGYIVSDTNTSASVTVSDNDLAAGAQPAARLTLVSNTGQAEDSTWTGSAGLSGGTVYRRAQLFTTGSNAGGYALSAVDLKLAATTGSNVDPTKVQVSIYTTSSGNPGTSLYTLTNPGTAASDFAANALNTFTAPANATLDANTTYAVLVESTDNTVRTRFRGTQSDAEDSGAASGWSIANTSVTSEDGGAWTTLLRGTALFVNIQGSAKFASNTGQTALSGSLVVGPSGGNQWRSAQLFTTGSSAAGYTLSAVDLRLAATTGGGTDATKIRVSIRTTSSGNPDTSLYTLTNPSSFANDAVNTFAAPANAALDAGTTYAVVVESTSTSLRVSLRHTNSDAEDSGAASGWSIADTRLGSSDGVAWSSSDSTLMIGVHGSGWPGPVVSIDAGSAVTEGAAATFTVSASPVPAADLTVSLTVAQTGDFVADANLRKKTVTVPTSGSATYTVPTEDDSIAESAGAVRLTANSATSYTRHGTNRSGSVTVSDNDGGGPPPPPPPPPDPPDPPDPPPGQPGTGPGQPGTGGGGAETPRREPVPLQLALWTDRPGYRAGETVRLYRTLDPHDDRGRYRIFVYLERAAGGERRWLAPLSGAGQLRDQPVDHRGRPAGAAQPQGLLAADRELAWEGPAPAPGLWQFVLELRPGAADEQFEKFDEPLLARRARARFVVAERSRLLNRRGFDREVRADLTLTADTLHYLQHQLFVRDGATLTIEAGTLVQGFGRNTAIIVEPGGRIVAEGTREAPVVLTCSVPTGQREPGCWGGLRILGRAPVTRLEGLAPGVLPAERAAYGGADAGGSSGLLRYVRVEFAGAGGEPDDPAAAIGLYGAGSGTVLERVQAHASLGDGFAFHGGAAACSHCVASDSGRAGLAWDLGWRGSAAHVFVQHGPQGLHGLDGGNDEEGHDRQPRSLPTLSNVTLVHSRPHGRRARRGAGVHLRTGSGLRARDLLASSFGFGGIYARPRAGMLFTEGESSVAGALLYLNGAGRGQLRGLGLRDAVEFLNRDPKLRDVRHFANPDPRPKPSSPALEEASPQGPGYIGAFGRRDNWLEGWTVFGPESVYDLRERSDDEN